MMINSTVPPVRVIGGGLAGCEAAWRLANYGHTVYLHEMKPQRRSPAHHSGDLAELVCSNSFKAARVGSAAGLLKAEMRLLGSLLLPCADACAIPAGGALAVDRHAFSAMVTCKICAHPQIKIIPGEVTSLDAFLKEPLIVATGPLTTPALSESIAALVGREQLSFFDAASPIIAAESIDRSVCFAAARYGRGGDDYLNCPMNRQEYEAFYEALVSAKQAELKDFEKGAFCVYEGCMPVETLAARGRDSLRFGPLKPVGLTDPRTERRPWAVAQLRQENSAATLYNLVGFQTNLTFPEQKRVFSLLPGLKNAEFVRYGVMHRNTFLDSPRLLTRDGSLRGYPLLFFAGQIAGVEGYMESASGGILMAEQLHRKLTGAPPFRLPDDTMLGALCAYITNQNLVDFQPVGANMGFLPPLFASVKDKRQRYEALAVRALSSIESMLAVTK